VVEDYAKAIYSLGVDGAGPVATSRLAERLGVTPGSVSAMVGKLDELGLASHTPYLHSALTLDRIPARDEAERRELLRFGRLDVRIAMGVAGVINLAMLVVAASLFYGSGQTEVDSIEGAHAGFEALLGGGAALAFAIALLSSGLSSSSVGAYSGQVVMQGFIRRRIRCSSAER
jgi:manganese transport protein